MKHERRLRKAEKSSKDRERRGIIEGKGCMHARRCCIGRECGVSECMHARRWCCITTACATRMSDAAAVPTAAVGFIRSSVPLHAKDDKRSRGETGETGDGEERERRGREERERGGGMRTMLDCPAAGTCCSHA